MIRDRDAFMKNGSLEARRRGRRQASNRAASGEWESFCLQKNGEIVRRIVCRGKWREEKSVGILSF
jgi:hypothetical protein